MAYQLMVAYKVIGASLITTSTLPFSNSCNARGAESKLLTWALVTLLAFSVPVVPICTAIFFLHRLLKLVIF
jgi:hypothetical protein